MEIPSIEQNLRVPEDGESIYEYLRSYLRVISLNTFAKNFLNTDKTFVEYLDEVIESSKQIEFEYAVNWFISNYFIKQNVDGEIVIGDHLNTFLQAQMVVRDSVAKLDIDVDDEGRPTKVVGLLTFYYSCTDQGETFDFDREMSINAKIDYKKNSSAFKIPEEALQSA